MQKEMVFYSDSQTRIKGIYLILFVLLLLSFVTYKLYGEDQILILMIYLNLGFFLNRIILSFFSKSDKKIKDAKIAVKIDEQGITDNILTKKLIKWEDVKDIKLGVATKTTYLLIFLENEHEYQKDLSFIKNTVLKLNLSIFGTGFSLQLALPEDKRQEFLSFCIQNLSKSRLNKQISKTISDN